jgi:hypothetical protein
MPISRGGEGIAQHVVELPPFPALSVSDCFQALQLLAALEERALARRRRACACKETRSELRVMDHATAGRAVLVRQTLGKTDPEHAHGAVAARRRDTVAAHSCASHWAVHNGARSTGTAASSCSGSGAACNRRARLSSGQHAHPEPSGPGAARSVATQLEPAAEIEARARHASQPISTPLFDARTALLARHTNRCRRQLAAPSCKRDRPNDPSVHTHPGSLIELSHGSTNFCSPQRQHQPATRQRPRI